MLESAALPAVEELRALLPEGLTMIQFALLWIAEVARAEGVGMVRTHTLSLHKFPLRVDSRDLFSFCMRRVIC